MVVRQEALRERIAALREAVARLRRLRASDSGSDDDLIEWATERGLQVAAQALFDVGNHLLSGAFSERPAEYAAIPSRLRAHGVISEALEERLRGLAGFRNLLVHDYVRVDFGRVRELLDTRLDDFDVFAAEVERWLEKHSGQGSPG